MKVPTMNPVDAGMRVPSVWCPIIPLERVSELEGFDEELHRLADVYDDWAASMRGKSVKGGDLGIYLDRIRILMFKIGVASGTNRDFAEKAQSIISETLRDQVLRSVKSIWEDNKSKKVMKSILHAFFAEIRFIRDIDPVEEMEKAARKSLSISPAKVIGSLRKTLARRPAENETVDEKYIRTAIVEATRIVLRSYMRLLSPDPWSLE
jgi:hypothetical protein